MVVNNFQFHCKIVPLNYLLSYRVQNRLYCLGVEDRHLDWLLCHLHCYCFLITTHSSFLRTTEYQWYQFLILSYLLFCVFWTLTLTACIDRAERILAGCVCCVKCVLNFTAPAKLMMSTPGWAGFVYTDWVYSWTNTHCSCIAHHNNYQKMCDFVIIIL